MARCPAHGNRIQLNSSRAVNLFGATPQPDCRRTREKGIDLQAAHLPWVPHLVKAKEAPQPAFVGSDGPPGVVTRCQGFPVNRDQGTGLCLHGDCLAVISIPTGSCIRLFLRCSHDGEVRPRPTQLPSVQEFAPFIPSTGANPPGDCRSPTCRPFLLGKVVNPGTPRG